MSVPPLVVDLRVVQADRRPFRLWLPLFLLWPLLLLAFVVAVVVAAVMDAVALASGRPHRTTAFVVGVFAALTEARGTELDIENTKTTVHLTVRSAAQTDQESGAPKTHCPVREENPDE